MSGPRDDERRPAVADVLVAGECVVDFIPNARGSLGDVEQFSRRAGGAPANVAVGLARLGRPPAFWTRLGTDPFGDFLAETLTREAVPSQFVDRDPAAKTTLAFVAHDTDADRSFTFYRDAAAETRMAVGRVPDETLQGVDWVVIGGVPLATEPSRSALLDLADRARQAGATVVFDPNVRPELWDDAVERVVREAFGESDVVKASPDDLQAAGFEGSVRELADAVLDCGPHTVLVTLGADGALGRSASEAPWGETTVDHSGYAVDAVDTTGAGDAFTAGAVDALADGSALSETVEFAGAVAALTTTAEGAMTALPDRDSAEAFRRDVR
jgi:fructokinase